MNERMFYDERPETKSQKLMCPSCHREDTYPIRWMVRTKKKQPPRGMNDDDRAHFAKAQSYMVRMDDLVACRKCRKRIELTGQSLAMVGDLGAAAANPDFDPETFGNR
ncbi:MAG: hypothetical protein ACRD5G_10070 [Candidatus Acidiferrales bacterium]